MYLHDCVPNRNKQIYMKIIENRNYFNGVNNKQ